MNLNWLHDIAEVRLFLEEKRLPLRRELDKHVTIYGHVRIEANHFAGQSKRGKLSSFPANNTHNRFVHRSDGQIGGS